MPVNIIVRTFSILSSQALLIWIIGGWIIYYTITAIWMEEAFGAFVAGLRQNIFLQLPYVLFIVVGVLNMLRASRGMYRRGKMRLLLWIILPLGLLLFFTGFFMSATLRESGQRFVGEGDLIDPPWTDEKFRITRIDPGLKDSLTDIDGVTNIFSHEPNMTVLDSGSKAIQIGAFPPAKLDNTYYHILNFGIAPGVRLFDNSRIKSEGYMILRIITPGSSDVFEIPPYPLRFLVSMEPEKTVHQAQTATARFNLKAPSFHVRVFKGEQVVAEGNPAEGVKIDNLTLYFFKPTYWVQLEAVKDPGVSVMHIGVILITFGVPLSFLMLGVNIFRRIR
jgi:hypothetical protein